MMAMLVMAMIIVLIIMALSLAKRYFRIDENPLIERVNALLPQTQCAQCGYPGCKPYATAMIEKNEAINRCPPGGDQTIKALADLLQRDVQSLNPENGVIAEPTVVKIREIDCIGCTLCLQACPVDAIVGAGKQMHTVIADLCTGCNLCIPPCPVDCIDIVSPKVKHV